MGRAVAFQTDLMSTGHGAPHFGGAGENVFIHLMVESRGKARGIMLYISSYTWRRAYVDAE